MEDVSMAVPALRYHACVSAVLASVIQIGRHNSGPSIERGAVQLTS